MVKYVIFLLMLASATIVQSDEDFEREVFEKTTEFIHQFRTKGDVSNAKSFFPSRAAPLISYAKKYFNEKVIMTDDAPKVN